MNVSGSFAATGRVRCRVTMGTLSLLLGVTLAVAIAGPAFGQHAERGVGAAATEPDPYVLDEYWNQWWWPTYKPTIYAVGPDITIDENGYVYAPFQFGRTGTTNGQGVMKVAPDGRIVARWGTLGSGEVQFAQPADIAVDTRGDIYVLDGGNRRVQKLDASGRFVRSWTVPHEPVSPPAFSSIAVGADRIYVAESNSSKVEVYTLDGGFVLSWGGSGTDPGKFRFLSGMAVDPDGNVWVVDYGNNRLQQFDKDGAFLRTWGSKGTAAGQLTKPVDVAFDSVGRMYVSDNAGGSMDSGRVQRVERNGTVSASWRPHRPGSITNTQGLAVDKEGTVFANEGGSGLQRWFVRGAKVRISTPVSKTKAPRAKRSFEIVSQLRPVRLRANRTWDTQGTYFELWAPKAKKPRILRATDRDRDYRQNGPYMSIHPHLKLTAGTWRIRAVVPADAEHKLTKSGYLKIKVRK